MRMSTGAPQQPVPPLIFVCSPCSVAKFVTCSSGSRSPQSRISSEGWDEEDILHLEQATVPELFGFDTEKIGSYLKLTREAEQLQLGGKTIIIASGAGAPVMHLSSQEDLDGFLLRLGAGGLLAAAATPQVVLKFSQEALAEQCDDYTPQQQKPPDDNADMQLFLTARAVRWNMEVFGGNEDTAIVSVLAPKFLQGGHVVSTRKKEGVCRFVELDGSRLALRPLI
ncbi:hypothetical protein JKP88DRAFT_338012 [Tribonema minus]|uniref:Uncharacterized protein n=1 Tax=Tribonema minus TaxID=303371 RepID=A0A835YR78_9STRA|nr:hypothetical protein JKP88DRAFT_338012 [Tribonema minus]